MSDLTWKDRVEDVAEDFLLDIADNIYRAMVRAGLNRTELAAKMGVKPAEVTHILGAHRNFTVKKISAVAVALDVSPQDLCERRRTKEREAQGIRLLPSGFRQVAAGSSDIDGSRGSKKTA